MTAGGPMRLVHRTQVPEEFRPALLPGQDSRREREHVWLPDESEASEPVAAFEPSIVLCAAKRRERRLWSNVVQASIFRPRLGRRAVAATQFAQELERIERVKHAQEATRGN